MPNLNASPDISRRGNSVCQSTMSRRSILVGTAAFVLARNGVAGMIDSHARDLVFDSRLPAMGQRVGIDVANGEFELWKALRSTSAQSIVGDTQWSDFLVVRGVLEERGMRVRRQSVTGSRVRWEMT